MNESSVPDDIVVLDEPGPQLFLYPPWCRWALVTLRGADGGNGKHSPGAKGQTKTFVQKPGPEPVQIYIGEAGRDWDGVRRNQGSYVLMELYR